MDTEQSSMDYFHKYLTGYNISQKEWKRISARTHYILFKKGQFLEREGDVSDRIGFIVSGVCRYFCLNSSGEEKTIVLRQSGSFISGYTSYLENKRAKLSIQALEDTTLLYITIKDYEYLLHADGFWPCFAWKQGMEVIIEKEKREIEILADDAETKYRKFIAEFPNLENRINHYHIASYLGISNVTLSRIRNKVLNETSFI